MKFSKVQISWLLYDPAASAYAMIVRTVMTPILLSTCAAGICSESEITSAWSLTASFAGIAAGAVSVFFGPMVDARRKKVQMVGIFTAIGVLSCIACILPDMLGRPSGVSGILAVSFIGLCSFMVSNSFYDSLLISVADADDRDRLSSIGYALGYAGALVSFLICLIILKIWGDGVFFRASFLLTAAWWLVGSIPLLLNVREQKTTAGAKGVRIAETIRFVFTHRNILIFLTAYFLYIDGVGTILLAATPLAAGLKISTKHIMFTILALQLFGLPFTILYGRLANRFSAKKMIYAAIGIYVTIAVLVTVMSVCRDLRIRQILFFICAGLIGTSQGGIQSLSRSVFSRIIPPERAAELFAVYNIFGKFTTIVGPFLIAAATMLWDKAELGITMMIVPFCLGAFMLSKVKTADER